MNFKIILKNRLNVKIFLFLVFLSLIINDVKAQRDKIFSDRFISKSMKKATFWQLKNPKHEDFGWHNGAFYAGVFAAYETTGSRKLYKALYDMGESIQWNTGKRWYDADDHVIGQTYVSMYRVSKERKMIQPLIDTLEVFLKNPYPARGIRKIALWWCDALFMTPPVLAQLGVTLGEEKYLKLNDKLFHEAYDLLWDKEENLFARDLKYVWGAFDEDLKESNGEKIFWGRGNGWVMAGLVRVLKELPANYPERDFYIDIYKKMSKKIASIQQEDGLWRASLLDPDAYPGGEASGSGFYAYALAWGINNGVLPGEEYLPVVEKTWRALCGLQHSNGMIGWVQPVGADPRKNFSADSWEVYGTGAFLLAGSEVIKLNRK